VASLQGAVLDKSIATSEPSELTRSRIASAWLFLAPMLFLLFLVAGWPLVRTIWFGFTDANLADLSSWKFVGFDNYLDHEDGKWIGLLVDSEWWRAVWNTVRFTLISVTLETIFGMVIALVLNASFPGRGVVRTAVLIPWAVPTIVSAKMWSWMLNDQFGIINDALMKLGFISHPLAWTANPDLSMIAVIMVDVWKTTPFMALLLLAGLQMLPSDCFEAAKVDGINPVKVFFKVTLPLIRPAVMVAVIFRALDSLRIFDLIYVLTSNSKDTMSMSVYARQQLVDFQEVGYGSAASTLLFMTVAVLIIVYMTVGRVRFDKE
jgi:trehalose/maltose transport system permease protein